MIAVQSGKYRSAISFHGKRLAFVSIFLAFNSAAIAQQELTVFHETKSAGFVIFATNTAACPISISLDLQLENMAFSEDSNMIFIIPENTAKFKIGELTAVKKSTLYRFFYNFRSVYGNVLQNNYDAEYEYWLPYGSGKSFLLIQGYNGIFSHLQQNALDFLMPEGTEITAAREGTVFKVVQSNTESCLRPECKKLGNFVLIYHSDNTIAEYFHIKLDGAKVKKGDKVQKGDIIALSGNTGYSSTPHLHFACYVPTDFQNRQFIKTKFKTSKSIQPRFLIERNQYLRSY